jgi:hypothetical protein
MILTSLLTKAEFNSFSFLLLETNNKSDKIKSSNEDKTKAIIIFFKFSTKLEKVDYVKKTFTWLACAKRSSI